MVAELGDEVTGTSAVGAFGIVAGVTALDATDRFEMYTPLVAFALNVYGVPFVKPVTAQLVPLGIT